MIQEFIEKLDSTNEQIADLREGRKRLLKLQRERDGLSIEDEFELEELEAMLIELANDKQFWKDMIKLSVECNDDSE